jgi:hypothetical protein
MRLPNMLEDLVAAERALADSFRVVSRGHPKDADVHFLTMTFARECDEQVTALLDLMRKFYSAIPADSEGIAPIGLDHARTGPLGLLRDLQDLHALADRVMTICQALRQAALASDDRPLVELVDACREQTQKQMDWLRTALDKAAPQALLAG